MKSHSCYRLLHYIVFSFFFTLTCNEPISPIIVVHYLGHSSFMLEFDNGVTVVTDYGHENAWAEWGWDSPIYNMGAHIPDVMTFSHQHDDHYDVDRIPEGVKHVLTGTDSLKIQGIEIVPVRTCEDDLAIESNTSYIFMYKGLRICHLGDAQAQIMHIDNLVVRNQLTQFIPKSLDLLFMTIEGKQKFIPQAEAFIDLVQPKCVIPMHYWSLEYRDEFNKYLKNQNQQGKKYHVRKSQGASFQVTSFAESDSILIVNLNRAPFKKQVIK